MRGCMQINEIGALKECWRMRDSDHAKTFTVQELLEVRTSTARRPLRFSRHNPSPEHFLWIHFTET